MRTRPAISTLLLLFVYGISSPAIAQRPLKNTLSDPAVLRGLADIESGANISAQQLVEIGGIISPSGQKLKRAKMSQRSCRGIGPLNVEVARSTQCHGADTWFLWRGNFFVATLDGLATVAEFQ